MVRAQAREMHNRRGGKDEALATAPAVAAGPPAVGTVLEAGTVPATMAEAAKRSRQ